MCIRRETRVKARQSLAFSPVSKPHTHITYMLRQCTRIVYIWNSPLSLCHVSIKFQKTFAWLHSDRFKISVRYNLITNFEIYVNLWWILYLILDNIIFRKYRITTKVTTNVELRFLEFYLFILGFCISVIGI